MLKNKVISIGVFILIFTIVNLMVFQHFKRLKNESITFLNTMIETEAKTLFENITATRQWNNEIGSVYVTQENGLKPNPYIIDGTLKTKEDKTLIKINHAWMTKQISEISNKINKHTFHMTSLKPLNPNNKPNSFETEALQYFEKNKNQKFYARFTNDFSNFEFMGSLKVKPSCFACHYSQNYEIGDIIGGISINIPTTSYQKKFEIIENRNDKFLLIMVTASILIFISSLFAILNFFNKKEVLLKNYKQLKDLKEENDILIKRYKYALEASQIGIWDWDLKTNEVYFDKNWKEMIGFKEDELPNLLESWDARVHPDDKDKAIFDIKNNHEKKTKFYKNMHRLKHKNGSWIWIYDKGRTYFDKDGNPIRMIGSHSNITQIKELELKLLEKEQNLSLAQEIAHMGHWKYYLNEDKFIVSDTLKTLIGLKDEKIGYDDFKKLIHPEDLQDFILIHKKALNSCKKRDLQYRLKKHNSDEYIYINEYISCISPLIDNENKIFLGTIQDITHLKDLEKDLNLFSTIINNSPLSIIVTNIKGEIIYVNPYFTKTSGYEKSEVMGKNPSFLKSTRMDQAVYKDLWETISNKKTWGGIFRNLTKKKKEYWESALIIPILNEKNEISNYLGIKREITKEIYLKEKLEEKEELILNQSKHAAMGEMISMIAHQWRQPITTISMSANNILADIELDMLNDEEVKKFAEQISVQTQYLSNTIEDFRNFFRQDKSVETVSLKTLFDDTKAIIFASLKNNNINLNLNFDETITISTFRRELVQVLINLIKNAKEALQENEIKEKIIDVDIEQINQDIVIKISDNAGGIKEEIIDKVFDAYFTTKDEQNGTGLGLYMSKLIIGKHLKGQIEAYNNPKGATFKIVLPTHI